MSYVKLTLAHPLRTVDAIELGLAERVYPQGEELTLLRRDAMRLVGAGFVLGAEPGNLESIQAALTPVKPEPAAQPSAKPAIAQGKSRSESAGE
ncbi:hypothetical protein GCM10027187_39720 [Streptosporangium sandarakinum]|uniref:Uncharacterized protein n=1 Tax=Streptosporangium sandarakinum TaxID=1260955 RepID=A0A852V4E7_9ACTN|nr:hypothetical protein [Streptosporangium sandarakinum]NYF44697.1 hypothetical protein [Streptosporangium sandarakinum]